MNIQWRKKVSSVIRLCILVCITSSRLYKRSSDCILFRRVGNFFFLEYLVQQHEVQVNLLAHKLLISDDFLVMLTVVGSSIKSSLFLFVCVFCSWLMWL